MNLDRRGREDLKLYIATEPPLTSWEASFDGGQTWHAGEPIPDTTDRYRWLVRGPDHEETHASLVATLPAGRTRVAVRAVDAREDVIRYAATITVE